MFNEVRSYSKQEQLKETRRVKKRGDRSKFSKMVRDQVKEESNNQCQMCFKRACHVHHVMPRARGGRNVYTNALLLCNSCHKEVHADEKLIKRWIAIYKKKHGKDFYKDEQDLIKEYQDKKLQEIQKSLEGEYENLRNRKEGENI